MSSLWKAPRIWAQYESHGDMKTFRLCYQYKKFVILAMVQEVHQASDAIVLNYFFVVKFSPIFNRIRLRR